MKQHQDPGNHWIPDHISTIARVSNGTEADLEGHSTGFRTRYPHLETGNSGFRISGRSTACQ